MDLEDQRARSGRTIRSLWLCSPACRRAPGVADAREPLVLLD
jgi:hypothetical protein